MRMTDRQTRVSKVYLARIHMGLGDTSTALDLLHKAADEHDPNLTWVASDPRSDVLRGDSRFDALVRRIGLA